MRGIALALVAATATACVPAEDAPPIPPWRPAASQPATPDPAREQLNQPQRVGLLVGLRAGRTVQDALAGTMAQPLAYDVPGVAKVVVPAAEAARTLSALRLSSAVRYAEPDTAGAPSYIPNDPYFPINSYLGGQWGTAQVNLPAAWDTARGSRDVRIAILDSGVSPTHPDLAAALVPGRNILNGTTNTADTQGHGTYVAGAAAAVMDNSAGIAGACGGCSILPVKMSDGVTYYASNTASAITWAANNAASAIVMSFGIGGKSATVDSAIAYARSKGVVVVAAAGNSGSTTPVYPANSPGVIAVAANDQKGQLQSTSNYGAWVDVSAPAGQLTTSLRNPYDAKATFGWMPVGGTSLSAPIVAGIAGLLKSARPTATGAQIETAILKGTVPIVGTRQVANGRVDAALAIRSLP